MPGLELIRLDEELFVPQGRIVGSLFQRQRLEILTVSLLAGRMSWNRAVNRDYLRTPIELTEILEEALEDLERRIELVMEIIEQEGDQNVQGVCGHVCGMTAQERRIESQPAFKQEDGLLQQIVLANKLRKLLDEVQGEKAAQLADTYVNWGLSNFEFDHQWIRLIHKIDI